MKLVEILARELEVWPDTDAITQWKRCLQITDDNGKIIGGLSELADDYLECYVTRPQWQAERDRMKAMEEISKFSQEQDQLQHPVSPTYEQQLWDRVAAECYAKYTHKNADREKCTGWAFAAADYFMAERAKRMGK